MDQWNGRSVMAFAKELRSIRLPRADIPMASSTLVFADVLWAIEQDGPRATALSLAGWCSWSWWRSGWGSGTSARSRTPAGCWLRSSWGLWFGGLAGAFRLRLNMLNFIALPITFGIGVDYATNVFQRRRLDHARSIGEVIRTTGGAVALCSLTTVIGYSSLLVARNQALISFGLGGAGRDCLPGDGALRVAGGPAVAGVLEVGQGGGGASGGRRRPRRKRRVKTTATKRAPAATKAQWGTAPSPASLW